MAEQWEVDQGLQPALTVRSLVSALRQNTVVIAIELQTIELLREQGKPFDEPLRAIAKALTAADRKMTLAINTATAPSGDPYDLNDPKHPEFHSTHADLFDSRDKTEGR